MGKTVDIGEFIELLNIPQLERIFYHKIEEQKSLLRNEIASYKKLKRDFRSEAYGAIQLFVDNEVNENKKNAEEPKEPGSPDADIGKTTDTGKEHSGKKRDVETERAGEFELEYGRTYRFDLSRDENKRWVTTEIEPPIPEAFQPSDVIPYVLVEEMATYLPHPTKVVTLSNFTLPDLNGRLYNLRFARYSHTHILGIITEIYKKKKTSHGAAAPDAPSANLIHITDCYKQESNEINYKELIRYMNEYPELKDFIFSEFFMRWKPFLDKKLL